MKTVRDPVPSLIPVPMVAHASRNVDAVHGTRKSGYARKVLPQRLEGEERAGLACPPASESGRQEGRIPPGDKQYTAKYESVTAEEAVRRAKLRAEGKLPPIKGGLDDDGMAAAKKVAEASREFDPFDAVAPDEGMGAPPEAPAPYRPPAPRPSPRHEPTGSSPEHSFLSQRRRVELELPDSTMRVAVIDVLVNRYGVTILLPMTDDGSTFVPKPGSAVTINDGDKTFPCYFPGASFEIPALHMMGLSFIRAEE